MDFLQHLTYTEWLVIVFFSILITVIITKIIAEYRSGVETNTGWKSYKDLFVEIGFENSRLKKRNESLTTMNNKMVNELRELGNTIYELSKEKALLQDKINLDADTKSQILS